MLNIWQGHDTAKGSCSTFTGHLSRGDQPRSASALPVSHRVAESAETAL